MNTFLTTRMRTLLPIAAVVVSLCSLVQQTHAATYWLQSQKISPPYPFDPYEGAVKVESLDEKGAHFLVLDTPEDYAALQALNAAEMELYEQEHGGVARNGPEDSEEAYAYGPEELWLEIVSKVDDAASFVIHTPEPEGIYDLFMTTNLSPNVPGLNLTNWVWLLRTEPGETNLVVTNLWADEAYFRLGTMLDSDNDGLTDAYENLVAHTSSSLPDSDGDGLSDGLEFQLSFNPLDAFSQDASHTFKDGQWYLTAKTGQAGTRAELVWDYAEYDPWDDITYLWFSVSGVAESEQHCIYIQTPSIDSTDTNLVWQDMFFNFGWLDDGYNQSTGTRMYVTAWWGEIANASFAALDGLDRDFDGLQDGYEILATQTAAGAPSSAGSGIPDGDAEPSADGISNLRKWQYGLNPWSPVSTQDTVGDGIPDWFRVYITIWFGAGATGAWVDADGDGVPNMVEFDIGSDPTIRDFGGYFPPPPSEDAEFVSLQYSVPYSDSQGPNGNSYFTTAGFSLGPLGVTAGITAIPSDFGGPGVADFQLDIMPVQDFYYNVWPFTDDGTPTQFELQRPDPDDAASYRALITLATSLSGHLWGQINEPLLQALRQRTLEYVSGVTKMKISYYCREIQWLDYQRLSLGENHPGLLLRIQHRASVIHTEMTKTTAIHLEYVDRYPTQGIRYAGKVLRGVQWLAFAVNLPDNLQQLRERIIDYRNDVRLHQDTAGPALLSIKLQEFISSIPGMPSGLITTTTPIFDPCPLGFYDGGGGSWQDCLWPY